MICKSNNSKLCGNIFCDICFSKSFASDERSLQWSENNDKFPWQVFLKSGKKYEFLCKICKHLFITSPHKIVSMNSWCPYCANQKLCFDLACDYCINKSFLIHPMAEYWSEENIICPFEVFLNTNKKYTFYCDFCEHTFLLNLNSVNRRNQSCPYCSYKQICGSMCCDFCLNNTFMSNIRAMNWSLENKLMPWEVFYKSDKIFKFDCECDHTFESKLSNISRGRWCPYCCSPPIKLCDNQDCVQCFNNSFAPNPYSKFLLKKNKILPREIFKTSNSSYFFKCEHNHIFKKCISNITMQKSWCPFCKKKTEEKLYKWLINNGYKVTYQAKYDWCKSKKNRYLPFDFALEDYDNILELDGLQHFQQVMNWQNFEKTHESDIYKMEKAQEKGYTIIRILQEDVWNDTNNWEEKLKKTIKKYKYPKIVCLSKKYKNFCNEITLIE